MDEAQANGMAQETPSTPSTSDSPEMRDAPQEEPLVLDDGAQAASAPSAASNDDGQERAVAAPDGAKPRGKHGRHAKAEGGQPTQSKESKGERKRREKQELPAYMKKSKRMRRILIVVLVLLIALFAVGAYFTWQLLQMAATTAQETPQADTSSVIVDDDSTDASTAAVKTITMPNLMSLLGKDVDAVVAELQRGAQVTSVQETGGEEDVIKTEVRVALTADASDNQTGTPTVYLGLNGDGLVVQAGCSASAAALGYGSVSFADAVSNEHIIENTLREAGLQVADGAAVLPATSAEYSTYDSDGTTLLREYCSFSGVSEADGCEWSAVLSYDYSMARATGNLTDTVRTVYVYISRMS